MQLNQQNFENTYRLEPKEGDRFYPSKVRDQIEMILTAHLKDAVYDHAMAKTQAEKIADEIKAAMKQNLNIPNYKIVVQTVIGQVSGQDVRVASKCLWDEQNDNQASFTFTNNSLFCTGIVFGIYYE
uniref:Uncharacterized protein n=1 Tax=Strombidium inclinatum TaxID=197538 RepID=A0A7S3IV91_9SPIT|mmetsp:Transcript_42667/g.65447  ORF Transcript_42667/g.65447 Transcript_42667/m.65447 type:complete len:127 (+) Transcript_42667:22-402(+)|eukprot:CAMPEP_0170491318 /NCGR_PEP_ID=MMETSP0208-20121228/10780_1 /TAXON_ID=197538 /ORGANISM="Strombidium inclinatum, Strain S3" /LENGTH=126 /DNA_ID=CAMNT_0010766871 /DNA_START=22 /DNA_END=402 /DNA_ORIENTATION=+